MVGFTLMAVTQNLFPPIAVVWISSLVGYISRLLYIDPRVQFIMGYDILDTENNYAAGCSTIWPTFVRWGWIINCLRLMIRGRASIFVLVDGCYGFRL